MVIVKSLYYFNESVLDFNGVSYKIKNTFVGKLMFCHGDFLINVFIKNNKYHRYYGAQNIKYNINLKLLVEKSWNFNDKFYGYKTNGYNQKQFIKDVNKRWLL